MQQILESAEMDLGIQVKLLDATGKRSGRGSREGKVDRAHGSMPARKRSPDGDFRCAPPVLLPNRLRGGAGLAEEVNPRKLRVLFVPGDVLYDLQMLHERWVRTMPPKCAYSLWRFLDVDLSEHVGGALSVPVSTHEP